MASFSDSSLDGTHVEQATQIWWSVVIKKKQIYVKRHANSRGQMLLTNCPQKIQCQELCAQLDHEIPNDFETSPRRLIAPFDNRVNFVSD